MDGGGGGGSLVAGSAGPLSAGTWREGKVIGTTGLLGCN
jgi:hypothetical protein